MSSKFFLIFVLLNYLNFTSAIFNGTLAKIHQFPYVVLTISPRFYCSASLISTKHVLTAAHCLMSIKSGGSAKVYLGSHEFNGVASDGTMMESKKFWIHEKFSMPSAEYDIGLVELPKEITPSKNINFIKIETRANVDSDANDRDVVLAGWGYTYPNTPSRFLRYTHMKMIPFSQCMPYKPHYIESLTKNHICVENKNDSFPCDGDSGSSLVSLKTGKLLGILSYVKDAENGQDMGYNDCEARVPAVATRIYAYLSWISQKSGLKF